MLKSPISTILSENRNDLPWAPIDLYRADRRKGFLVAVKEWPQMQRYYIDITLEKLMKRFNWSWESCSANTTSEKQVITLDSDCALNTVQMNDVQVRWNVHQCTTIPVDIMILVNTNKREQGFKHNEVAVFRLAYTVREIGSHDVVLKRYHLFGIITDSSNLGHSHKYLDHFCEISEEIRALATEARAGRVAQHYHQRIAEILNELDDEFMNEIEAREIAQSVFEDQS
jgi:hypothetical protein